MPWPRTRKPSTRDLVRADHRLRATRSGRFWPLAVLVLLGLIAAGQFIHLQERDTLTRQLAEQQAQNRALQEALEQSSLQRRETLASEEQLLRRIEEMSAQIKRLKTDLNFYRQQKSH